jgi:hypothetical protein
MFQARRLSRLGLALALILIMAGRASADLDIATYNLTTSNLSGSINANPPYTGPFATVTVDLTDATHATITFDSLTQLIGGNTYVYLFHSNGAVGVNVNATSWGVSNISGSNSYASTYPSLLPGPVSPSDGGASTFDGYTTGQTKLNQSIDLTDGFQASATEIQFTLTNTSGMWTSAHLGLPGSVLTPTGNNQIAAAQIGAWKVGDPNGYNPTGFAGDASLDRPPIVSGVPEPSTMALVALGAVGFLGYGLRRLLRR